MKVSNKPKHYAHRKPSSQQRRNSAIGLAMMSGAGDAPAVRDIGTARAAQRVARAQLGMLHHLSMLLGRLQTRPGGSPS